jgi:hypothetical protein
MTAGIGRTTAWVLGVLLLTILPARAGAEALAPERFDPSLRGLRFGMTIDETVAFLKQRVENRYGVLIRDTMDVRDRDRLRREAIEEAERIGQEIVKFDGTRSGWNVSVVKDEFGQGFGEEMLHLREGKTHLYFFFTGGVFYKLVISADKDQRNDHMLTLANAYGAPEETVYADPVAKEGVQAMTWEAGDMTLRVEDRSRDYQCCTLRWADAKEDQAVQAKWPKKTAGAIDPLILESMDDGSEIVDDEDPVGDLLGVKPAKKAKPKSPRKKK